MGLFNPSASSSNLNVVSKTSNYTATSADNVILCDSSGGTFSITLPTAVGITGKVYELKKTDTTFTSVSIATTSAQTIDGLTAQSLSTQGECITLVSDGSNWQILDRRIPAIWTSYTPTITGFGTPTSVVFFWKRDGSNIRVEGSFTSGTTSGSPAGIAMPTGLSVDAGVISSAQTVGDAVRNNSTPATTKRWEMTIINASSTSNIFLTFADTNGASPLVNTAGTNVATAGEVIVVWADVPVSGWGG